MLRANVILVALLFLGILFSNNLVAAGAGTLLVLKLINFSSLLEMAENRALEWGLLFLLIAVMAPFAREKVGLKEICQSFTTPVGLLSILGGTLATCLCGQGVTLLKWRPEIMVGLVIGTVIGVSFLKGIPVGPMAAAGLTAIILRLLGLNKK